jgi:hypothetical protein
LRKVAAPLGLAERARPNGSPQRPPRSPQRAEKESASVATGEAPAGDEVVVSCARPRPAPQHGRGASPGRARKILRRMLQEHDHFKMRGHEAEKSVLMPSGPVHVPPLRPEPERAAAGERPSDFDRLVVQGRQAALI